MKNKNQKENWEKLVMRIEKITLDCHLNSISQEEARDEILELSKSEREKCEKEKIMAIDKRILDKIKRKQGTDEFYETIVKPIEKRVKNQLLEKIAEIIDDNNDLLRWQKNDLLRWQKEELKEELKRSGSKVESDIDLLKADKIKNN